MIEWLVPSDTCNAAEWSSMDDRMAVQKVHQKIHYQVASNEIISEVQRPNSFSQVNRPSLGHPLARKLALG